MPHPSRAPLLLVLPLLAACGEDSTDPGIDLDLFVGTYVLAPEASMTCPIGDFGDVTLTLDTIEVTDVSGDSIWLRVPIGVSSSFGDMRSDAEFAIDFDGEGDFGGLYVVDVDVPAGVTTAHADGELTVDGAFADADGDSFGASLGSDVAVALGGGSANDCTDVDLDVIGTRVD